MLSIPIISSITLSSIAQSPLIVLALITSTTFLGVYLTFKGLTKLFKPSSNNISSKKSKNRSKDRSPIKPNSEAPSSASLLKTKLSSLFNDKRPNKTFNDQKNERNTAVLNFENFKNRNLNMPNKEGIVDLITYAKKIETTAQATSVSSLLLLQRFAPESEIIQTEYNESNRILQIAKLYQLYLNSVQKNLKDLDPALQQETQSTNSILEELNRIKELPLKELLEELRKYKGSYSHKKARSSP